MEATAAVMLLLFLAAVGAMVFFVVRLVKPSPPAADAPAPAGFHQRQRMELREFYETYYLKPGSLIRMNQVQAGLTMFAMEVRVPAELLRPTDRISDFGDRGHGLFTTLVVRELQEAIARKPELAACKLESVDDMIQIAFKADALPEEAGDS